MTVSWSPTSIPDELSITTLSLSYVKHHNSSLAYGKPPAQDTVKSTCLIHSGGDV
jgi:hypothetical protein